jgi:hypothetical protein
VTRLVVAEDLLLSVHLLLDVLELCLQELGVEVACRMRSSPRPFTNSAAREFATSATVFGFDPR